MVGTSERQLFRARFAWLCKWLLSDVCGGGRFTVKVVCLPTPLLDRLPVERVSGDLADFTRQLERDAALLLSLLSRLDLLSVATRVDGQWNLLVFQAGSLVTVRSVKYGVSSLMDSSVRACTAIQYSVLAGTTAVKLMS